MKFKRIYDNPMVTVREPSNPKSLEHAIDVFNRRLQSLGLFKKLREKEGYEKPGDKKRRRLAASIKRCRARAKNKGGR